MTVKEMLTSKTLWGALVVVIGWLAQTDVLAVLHIPPVVGAWMVALGGILTATGLRDALSGNTMELKDYFKSKSILGVVAMALGYLIDSGQLAALGLPDAVARVLIAAGGLLTALGYRKAAVAAVTMEPPKQE